MGFEVTPARTDAVHDGARLRGRGVTGQASPLAPRPVGASAWRWAALTFCLGLLATAAVVSVLRATSRARDDARFAHEVEQARGRIVERFHSLCATLTGAAGLLEINPDLTAEEFRAFVARQRLEDSLPGTLGVGFTRRFSAGERDSVVAFMRSQGVDGFEPRPPGERGEYHAILYIEPRSERNLVAVGYDMFTEPVRREAMERARDTGLPALSGKVTLVQETEADKQAGFLLYVPVYRGGWPSTVEQRRSALLGFAYSPLRADDMMHGVFPARDSRMVDVSVFDGAAASPDALLHQPQRSARPVSDRARDVPIEVAQRVWTLRVSARPEFSAGSAGRLEPYVIGIGLVLSLALAAFSLAQARAHAAVRQGEARMRAVLESALDAIITMDARGRIVEFNPAAERMFGYRRDAVLGRTVAETIVPERMRAAHAAGIKRYFETGHGPVLGRRIEIEGLRADGTETPVELAIVPTTLAGHSGVTFFTAYLRDLSERRAAGEALRQSEERYRTLVDQVKDYAIFAVDVDGRPTTWNQGVRRVLGYDQEEFLGLPAEALFTPEDIAAGVVRSELSEAAATGHAGNDRWMMRKDGRRFWAMGMTSALRDPRGGLIGFTKVMRDQTDWKMAEIERNALLASERAARSELEKASRMKDEFLATLSHELRTPLNAILGWSHLLRKKPEDIGAGLETVERNARAQLRIIEDLLDMSRITSGKIRLDTQSVELAEVVRNAIESVRPAAEAKGIRIHTVLDPRSNSVSGDPSRLQQVVWNLLSNAVKFTPKGGKVQVVLRRVDSHAEIIVTDTGKGISPDFLPHVFDRFRQEDASTTRRYGGLGLGLSIVKHLVELHGGAVRVSSPGEDQGSTFSVELPLRALAPMSAAAADERPQPAVPGAPAGNADCPALRGVTVLVVDDELDSRAVVRQLLEDCDAVVTTASSVAEATELFVKVRPRVLLSDIGMPDRDGYDLIRWVRSLPPEQGGRTPAAALTALARSEDRTRALLAGYQVHVSKPIEPAELVAVVVGLAALSARGGEAAS